VVNKVNTARKNLRKNFNKFNKIAVSNGVTNITIERWLATKLMKTHEEKNKPDIVKKPVLDWVNSHSTVAPKYYKEAVELLGPAKEGQAPRTPGQGARAQKGLGKRAKGKRRNKTGVRVPGLQPLKKTTKSGLALFEDAEGGLFHVDADGNVFEVDANEELLQVDAAGSEGEFHVGGEEALDVESGDEDVDSKFRV